jgi:hypothetical protein
MRGKESCEAILEIVKRKKNHLQQQPDNFHIAMARGNVKGGKLAAAILVHINSTSTPSSRIRIVALENIPPISLKKQPHCCQTTRAVQKNKIQFNSDLRCHSRKNKARMRKAGEHLQHS